MRNPSNQNNPIDDYIKSIEATESAKQRRKFIMLTAFAVIIIGVGIIVWLYLPKNSRGNVLTIYDLKDLDEQIVLHKLSNQPEGIIVFDDVTNLLDTIRSMDRYREMLQIHNAFATLSQSSDEITVTLNEEKLLAQESDRNPTEEESLTNSEPTVTEQESVENPQTSIRTYPIDIAGERVTGNELNFTVEFYNPDHIYLIDYGNGDRKRVEETHAFSYENPGSYAVTLTAIDPTTNSQSEYTKQLTINKAPDIANQTFDREVQENTDNEPLLYEAIPVKEPVDKFPVQDSVEREYGSVMRSGSQSERQTLLPMEATRSETLENTSTISESEASIPENMSMANPMEFAEKMPSYPGGINAMTRFLNSQLEYPGIARDNEIEGTVYVQFVISPNGSLSNFKVVKGIGYKCDEEALRVAQQMNSWIPGEHLGKKVPVIYTIPVNFAIR